MSSTSLNIRPEVWAIVLVWPDGGYCVHAIDSIWENVMEGFCFSWGEMNNDDLRKELENGTGKFGEWTGSLKKDTEGFYDLGEGYSVHLRKGRVQFPM